jgi:hypothetical protein
VNKSRSARVLDILPTEVYLQLDRCENPKLAVSNISLNPFHKSGPVVNKNQLSILSDIESMSLLNFITV